MCKSNYSTTNFYKNAIIFYSFNYTYNFITRI